MKLSRFFAALIVSFVVAIPSLQASTRHYLIHEEIKFARASVSLEDFDFFKQFFDAGINLLRLDLYNGTFPSPIEPYDRKVHFGSWVNDPRDPTCFDTRAKVLIRDSAGPVIFGNANRCRVEAGQWHDPYSGRVIQSAREIHIDHFVPLKHAYQSGAHRWGGKIRCLYANFLGNPFHLLAVDGRLNMSKGDRTPAEWMPADPRYHCAYLSAWMKTKMIWGLVLSEPEVRGFFDQVRRANCDPRWFRWSRQELADQRAVVAQNVELCSHRKHSDDPF